MSATDKNLKKFRSKDQENKIMEFSQIESVVEVLIPDNLIKLEINKKESEETEKRLKFSFIVVHFGKFQAETRLLAAKTTFLTGVRQQKV